MSPEPRPNRRTVLKATGGLLSLAGLSGTAAAEEGQDGSHGRGNGIGAFLNEEAVLKDRPVWDSGVADMTGQSEVEVSVGTLTSVDVPEEIWPGDGPPPEKGPFGFAPRAVKVSPGTDVTWAWVTDHHSVTSYNASASTPEEHGQTFDTHGDRGHEFTVTFDEVDTHLYFCHPHGTPYPMAFGPFGEVPNHVGMRGAVLVSDD